jgi:phosphate transport system permease protein
MHKFWKSGDPFIWLSGVALMFSLLMIGGLIFLIAAKGLGFFWPSDVVVLRLKDGTSVMGVLRVMRR